MFDIAPFHSYQTLSSPLLKRKARSETSNGEAGLPFLECKSRLQNTSDVNNSTVEVGVLFSSDGTANVSLL